jgi:hypothetical protein
MRSVVTIRIGNIGKDILLGAEVLRTLGSWLDFIRREIQRLGSGMLFITMEEVRFRKTPFATLMIAPLGMAGTREVPLLLTVIDLRGL